MPRLLFFLSFAAMLPLGAQFISSDTYTRYELLAPESHQFRIIYEVTETTPLAKFHYNIIRPGSEARMKRSMMRRRGSRCSSTW